MHRAEAQRRREHQNQDFVALTCEKPFQPQRIKCLLGLTGEAGSHLVFSAPQRLCARICFYGAAKYLYQTLKTRFIMTGLPRGVGKIQPGSTLTVPQVTEEKLGQRTGSQGCGFGP